LSELPLSRQVKLDGYAGNCRRHDFLA
jgi:hypothetical protein